LNGRTDESIAPQFGNTGRACGDAAAGRLSGHGHEGDAAEVALRPARGSGAITAVVDDFVGNVAADNRINKFFAKTDIPRLKRLLVEQICAGTGGPCTYTGRDMKSAHAGMGITDAQFNALVEDLVKSLDKFKVPEKEKGELLGILGPMKPSIVGQ
jgi:hemoglobin